ncbi:MAG: hypothetical protein V1859_03335 [archaeon]
MKKLGYFLLFFIIFCFGCQHNSSYVTIRNIDKNSKLIFFNATIIDIKEGDIGSPYRIDDKQCVEIEFNNKKYFFESYSRSKGYSDCFRRPPSENCTPPSTYTSGRILSKGDIVSISAVLKNKENKLSNITIEGNNITVTDKSQYNNLAECVDI